MRVSPPGSKACLCVPLPEQWAGDSQAFAVNRSLTGSAGTNQGREGRHLSSLLMTDKQILVATKGQQSSGYHLARLQPMASLQIRRAYCPDVSLQCTWQSLGLEEKVCEMEGSLLSSSPAKGL